MPDTQFKAIVVPNDQVASFHRKHGAPTFSKPHGTEKTILYYPDPEATAEKAAEVEFEDYAGQETPFTKDLVIQGNPSGSMNVSRTVRSGHVPHRVALEGNPNRAVSEAKIENEGALDQEVKKLEEDYMKKRLEEGPAAMGLPALSLGEKVGKVDQEPIKEQVDVELPTDPKEPEEGEPDLGRKRAPGDEGGESGGGEQKSQPQGGGEQQKSEDELWEGK